MFLLTCDKKLTKSQLSPTHASTKRKITDELKHKYTVRSLSVFSGTPSVSPGRVSKLPMSCLSFPKTAC